MQRNAPLVHLIYKRPPKDKHEKPMKKFLFLLAVIAIGSVQLFAEEPQTKEPKPLEEMNFWERFLSLETPNLYTKFEVRVGMPLYDLNHLKYFADGYGYLYGNVLGGTTEMHYYDALENEFLVNAYKNGMAHWGYLPEVNFMMNVGDNWQFGLSTCFAWMNQNRYSTMTGEVVQVNNARILVASPMVRYNLINNNWLRFYVQAGFYGLISHQTGHGMWFETEFFGGYGVAVGGRFYAFAETNYGSYVTYAQSFGVGYRF